MSELAEALELRRWLREHGHAVRSLTRVPSEKMGPYLALERERIRVLQSTEARGAGHGTWGSDR